LLVVRSGKGDVYREVPLNNPVREVLELVKRRSAAFVGDWLAPPEARMAAATGERARSTRELVWTAKEQPPRCAVRACGSTCATRWPS
jgi:hypothetical protein